MLNISHTRYVRILILVYRVRTKKDEIRVRRFGMFGRKYQWVIMGTYAEEWWLRPGGGCEPVQLAQALHGAILTDLLPITTEKRKTIAGIVSTKG